MRYGADLCQVAICVCMYIIYICTSSLKTRPFLPQCLDAEEGLGIISNYLWSLAFCNLIGPKDLGAQIQNGVGSLPDLFILKELMLRREQSGFEIIYIACWRNGQHNATYKAHSHTHNYYIHRSCMSDKCGTCPNNMVLMVTSLHDYT